MPFVFVEASRLLPRFHLPMLWSLVCLCLSRASAVVASCEESSCRAHGGSDFLEKRCGTRDVVSSNANTLQMHDASGALVVAQVGSAMCRHICVHSYVRFGTSSCRTYACATWTHVDNMRAYWLADCITRGIALRDWCSCDIWHGLHFIVCRLQVQSGTMCNTHAHTVV